MNFPILSTLIFLPLLSSLFILLFSRQKKNLSAIYTSLFSSVATFILALFLWKFFDIKLIDGFGPDGISALIKKCSLKANKFQSGFIYQYAFVMLLGFSALLTFLIVK